MTLPSERSTTDQEPQVSEVEQRIAEIRSRLAATTKDGTPWFIGRRYDRPKPRDGWEIHYRTKVNVTVRVGIVEGTCGNPDIDAQAEFVASAPSDIAYLLEQLASVPAQIEAAVQAEREACAKVAESDTMPAERLGGFAYRREIAHAIRSRGVAK